MFKYNLILAVAITAGSTFAMDEQPESVIAEQKKRMKEFLDRIRNLPPEALEKNSHSYSQFKNRNLHMYKLINPDGEQVSMCFGNDKEPELPKEAQDENGNIKEGWKIAGTILE